MIFRVQCHATVYLINHVISKLWTNHRYIYIGSRNDIISKRLIYSYHNDSFVELPGFFILIHQLDFCHVDAIVRRLQDALKLYFHYVKYTSP